MEAAAQKEDFAAALTSLGNLKAKVEAFLPELKKLQQAEEDYKKARAALKPKLDDALVQANDFQSDATLTASRAAIVTANSDADAAATAQDFEKALQIVNDLAAKVDAYLAAAKTKQAEYTKKADDISKKLDDAGYFGRDNVAREEVANLSADDIQHLPTAVRNRLLEELQEGNFSDEDKAACKKLYSTPYMDPEFQKMDEAARKKMLDTIKNDAAFKTDRANWASYDDKKRAEVMKRAVDYQADAYGIPKTTVEPYDESNPLQNGFYRHSEGKLYLSKQMMQNKGFDKALETAIHENGHRQQATLIDRLEGKTPPPLKPGDPEYNQAMTFKLNDTQRGFYVQPPGATPTPDTGNEYFTQPQENHSRINGDAIRNAGVGT
jgi:hypothetical protein